MKLFTKYIIIFISFLIVNGCDKPAPTELTHDEEQIEVEVITKDTNDEFYKADSSGVVEDLNRFVNIISISGIKITSGPTTIITAFAQAIFFDRSRPIHRGNGKLLAYHTRVLGSAKFNDVEAKLFRYAINYKDGDVVKEVNLGFRHVLNSLFPGQDFNYQFNSSVAFNFDLLPIFGGNSFGFDIQTPSEITGNVRFEGNRRDNTLKAILRWNGEHHPKFEIIVGASVDSSRIVFPLFRLKTNDDGELVIPPNLINRIPSWFDKVVFSLVRKIDFYNEGNDNDLYILSQSIHSLVINIP